MSDTNPRRTNGESRFDQKEPPFDTRANPDYFVSQQKKPYGQYQRYSEERPVFGDSREQRPLRTEPESYREWFAPYPGGAPGFDQIPTEYQPFGGSNREMNYSGRNHSDLREGFFSGGPQYQQDSALMETHFSQQRNFSATAAYQKEDDLEYDRGFPPADRDTGSGLPDANVSKTLGPMFVIGQNNPPPGAGRRW